MLGLCTHRYQHLNRFEIEMQKLALEHSLLTATVCGVCRFTVRETENPVVTRSPLRPRHFLAVFVLLLRWPCAVLQDTFVSLKHEADKLIVVEKAGLVFVFNFHPTKSFSDYRIGVNTPGWCVGTRAGRVPIMSITATLSRCVGCYSFRVVLSSDAPPFGGHNRVDTETDYFTANVPHHGRSCSMQVYSPSRTALVFARKP